MIVPAAESEALYARAGEPRKLAVIEGAGHYDLYTDEPFEMVMGEALAWFAGHMDGA